MRTMKTHPLEALLHATHDFIDEAVGKQNESDDEDYMKEMITTNNN